MKTNNTIEPYDLVEEGKPFHACTPEEQQVILEEFGSEDGYANMLSFSGSVKSELEQEGWMEPSDRVKDNVMAAFEQEHLKHRQVWYNALFAFLFPERKPIYQMPGFQFAAVALLVGVSWVLVLQFNESGNIADNEVAMNEDRKEEAAEKSAPEPAAEAEEEMNEASVAKEQDGVVVDATTTIDERSQQDKGREEREHMSEVAPEEPMMTLSEDMVLSDAEMAPMDDAAPAPPDGYTMDMDSEGAETELAFSAFGGLDEEEDEVMVTTGSGHPGAGGNRAPAKQEESPKRDRADLPKASVSVGEQSELIDILYTAY